MRIKINTNGRRSASPMRIGLILTALVVALPALPSRTFAQDKPAPAKTLYQRLGGFDTIAGIVDDFIGQLKDDPAFKRFGGGRSKDSLMRTRELVVEQICYLTGGPCVYIGRDAKTAHAGLAITQEEWDSNIKKFKVSLDKLKVAELEQKEFLAMIEKLRPDIVEKPTQEKPKQDTPKTQN